MKKINKRLVSFLCAIVIAVIVEFYFAVSCYFLITLTAIFVFQFQGPKSLPHVLRRFFILTAILLAGLGILRAFEEFPFAMRFYGCMHDMTLGAIVSALTGWIVFPIHEDEIFRLAVVPILESYSAYLVATKKMFLGQDESKINFTQAKQRAEQMQLSCSPTWAYSKGFNPELRKGHKHFLIRLGQFSQVLFSLSWPARHVLDEDFIKDFEQPISQCITRMTDLMKALILRLELKVPEKIVPDFSEDIRILEMIYHEVIPEPLTLLDMSEEVIYLAEFIYNLKDLQKVMLKLAESLR